MRIVHISTSDSYGGASRAALRVHEALLNAGHNSNIVVQKKGLNSTPNVFNDSSFRGKLASILNPHIDQIAVKLYRADTNIYFSPSILSFNSLAKLANSLQPDIIHLHWVCKGAIPISAIPQLNAPIILSLHDTWAFTGGCHITNDCLNYQTECGKCPALRSDSHFDLSTLSFMLKLKAFRKVENLTVVGVSQWITSLAQSSSILGTKLALRIPNPINTDVFKPMRKELAKEILNLPLDKKVILFGGMSCFEDKNKGFDLLLSALQDTGYSIDNSILVIFGSSVNPRSIRAPIPVKIMGTFHDDLALRIIYSAADVTVVASRQESFCQVATESLACGTPVVSFATSGLLDIIIHKENGYLAEPFSSTDLARGISWILSNEHYFNLVESARNTVVNNFSYELVSSKLYQLYQNVLSNSTY